MSRWKKYALLLTVTGLIGASSTLNVRACDKTPNCYNTQVRRECEQVRGNTGPHTVVLDNGRTESCSLTIVDGPHRCYCKGCGAYTGLGYAKCSETHTNSHCTSRSNMCK